MNKQPEGTLKVYRSGDDRHSPDSIYMSADPIIKPGKGHDGFCNGGGNIDSILSQLPAIAALNYKIKLFVARNIPKDRFSMDELQTFCGVDPSVLERIRPVVPSDSLEVVEVSGLVRSI